MYIDEFDELLDRYNALRLGKDIGVPARRVGRNIFGGVHIVGPT
jgi:hypothetical protein